MNDDKFVAGMLIACLIVAVIIAPVIIPFAAGLWVLYKLVGWVGKRWL